MSLTFAGDIVCDSAGNGYDLRFWGTKSKLRHSLELIGGAGLEVSRLETLTIGGRFTGTYHTGLAVVFPSGARLHLGPDGKVQR